MCIKREKSTDMPLINNGIVKPKKILAKKPVLNKSLSLSEVIDQFVLVKGQLPANKTGAEETKVQTGTRGKYHITTTISHCELFTISATLF